MTKTARVKEAKKLKKKKSSIEFLGSATEQVTGSMVLINTADKKILLECGGVQKNNIAKDYAVNSRPFEFRPTQIDAVFLMHSHIDHVMLVPRLVREGYVGPIICPKGNRDVLELLWKDSAFILKKERERLIKSKRKKIPIIFDEKDVEKAMQLICEFETGQEYMFSKGIYFQYFDSQHLVGAAQILLKIKDKNKTKKILYTSDIGNTIHKHAYFIKPFVPVSHADIVIGESTYCSKEKSVETKTARLKDIKLIKDTVDKYVINEKSKVLVPVFANYRSFEIIKILHDLYLNSTEEFDIMVDSPLAIKIIQSYEKLFEGRDLKKYKELINWDRLHFTENTFDSKKFLYDGRPKIIISASGMITAGRSVRHLANMVEDESSAVIITGYAGENTLAGMLKNDMIDKVEINGNEYEKKINVFSLISMSGHMQHKQLLEYYTSINCKELYLVHGNGDREIFASELLEVYSEELKTTKVIIPKRKDSIEI